MILWLKAVAITYGIQPEFALAVARIESGTKTQEYRIGPMGKGTYYGPLGIHKDFLKKWPINNPYMNILIGVKALQGKDQVRVLRRYNKTCDQAYLKAVFAFRNQLVREKYFASIERRR